MDQPNPGACVRAIDAGQACRLWREVAEVSSAKGKHDGVSCAGRSLIEILWDALMDAYAELMNATNGAHVLMPEDELEIARLKGECLGKAHCIALVTNPYYVNIDAVREEAAARWEAMSST